MCLHCDIILTPNKVVLSHEQPRSSSVLPVTHVECMMVSLMIMNIECALQLCMHIYCLCEHDDHANAGICGGLQIATSTISNPGFVELIMDAYWGKQIKLCRAVFAWALCGSFILVNHHQCETNTLF